MKTNTKRIIAGVIAGILALFMILPFVLDVVFSAKASSHAAAANTISGLNNKLSSLNKEKKQIQEEIKRVENQKKSTMEKKEYIDKQINVTEQEIGTINSLIRELNTKISVCEEQLIAVQKEEEAKYKLFKQRVRAMEEGGRVSFISVIFSADSFSSLLSRAEIINDIVSHDRKLMNELKEKKKQVAKKKNEIEQGKSEQTKAKTMLASRQSTLSAQYQQTKNLIGELNQQADDYKKAYDEAEAAQNSAKNELKKMLEELRASSGNSAYVGGQFTWPTPGCSIITSPYGMRFDPIFQRKKMHTGVDIGARKGSKIVAANSGTVIVAGFSSRGYGNYVVVNHGGGMSTLYAHMSRIAVSKGDKVNKGDAVGYVGSTGYSTGPHLHFEILKNGDHVNPMGYFRKG